MELHCLHSDTPTTVSSCSTDPLYDNCPPFAQRNRSGEKEMQSKVVSPRLPGPCSPGSALSPAVAGVPTWFGGGRAPGAWPDHSYCSWGGGLGRQGWAATLGSGKITGRGGGGGGRGGEQGGRLHLNPSPDPSQSDQHRSALSLYDNIPDDVTPDNLQEDFEIENRFLEQVQEQLYQVWAPEHFQAVMEGEGVSEDKSQWSSCEIVLSAGVSSNQDQDKKEEREPEEDSGFSGLQEMEQSLLQLPVSLSSSQTCPAEAQGLRPPAEVQHLEQASWSPRVPPPIPQADPSASALRSLLTSLQQQIVRQREEYEQRITSLEQRNEELRAEVVRLKTNLTQQRHWYQAVEAKIVESEKARAAAELHNATLQREMEQFFDTFGELNKEAKKTEYIVKSF